MADIRVLIIEDDAELCDETAEILRSEGYDAKCVYDPEKGENLIERYPFDIVILDYKMPGMSGLELLKRIKAKNAKTKVIITTGKPFIEKLIEDEKLGHLVSRVIHKPFGHQTLLEAINNISG